MQTCHQLGMWSFRGFHKLDEIANNANIGIREFTTWKQKNSVKMLPPVGIEPELFITSDYDANIGIITNVVCL